ncbi:MAG TPA: hypothetical protein VFH73_29030 [Polyangia bacterium]|nr:hypothetical protein [Polyangia bacterium]
MTPSLCNAARTLFAVLLVSGPPACSANEHDLGPDQRLTEARSFVIGGALTLTAASAAPNFPNLPARQDFTLRIDPSGRFLVLGDKGFAVQVPVQTTDGITFETTELLQMFVTVPTTCSATITYTRLSVTVGTGGVSGTAEGDMTFVMGDVLSTYKAKLAFTGAPDQVGPTLLGVITDVDPLSGLYIPASEPLAATAVGRLIAGGEVIDLESYVPTGSGVVSGFETPRIALRYATTYQMTVAPWSDLAANPGGALPKVITLPAPPQVAEDGFENETATVGGAAVVGANVLPPVAGQKSVAVVAGFLSGLPELANSRRFTARLAVGAADTKVRVAFRRFGSVPQAINYGLVMQIAVPGGAIVAAQLPQSEMLSTEYPLPSAVRNERIWLGDVQTIELLVPPGAGSEIVFDAFHAGWGGGCGMPLPGVGILIDDLRAE